MLGTRTVVFANRRPTRRQISRSLSAAGIETHFVETPAALLEAIESRAPQLVLIDCDTSAVVSIAEALSTIRQAENPPGVILLSVGQDKTALLDLIRTYDIGNLIAKHGAIRATYPIIDEHELLVTCEKVLRRDIFGIDKYVGLWGVVLHSSLITRFDGVRRFLKRFRSFIDDLDVPSTVAPFIVGVAEELISNAMIHAPVDAEGNPKYRHLPRSRELRLEPGETVQVGYGCDGQRLMLSVSDNFGRLDKETLYKYLAAAFQKQLLTPEDKPSGAGLGLSMSFHSIHQLIFNIHDHQRTEAIAGWYLRLDTTGEFRKVEKSLNIFWLPEGSEPSSEVLPPLGEDREPEIEGAEPWRSFEASDDGSVIALRGRVDGETDFSRALGASVIDLRAVTSFNSPGVLAWRRFIQARQGKGLVLRACPQSLVSQAAMIKGMMERVQVETVLAPYSCNSCELEQDLERRVIEVFRSRDLSCAKCGGDVEFAGLHEEYEALFQFATSDQGASPRDEGVLGGDSISARQRPSSSGSSRAGLVALVVLTLAVATAVTIYLLGG